MSTEMEEAEENRSTRGKVQGITPRAFAIGLILIPIMCFWNEYTEIIAEATDLAAMSLIIAVVFALFVLLLLPAVRPWLLPKESVAKAFYTGQSTF